MGDTGVSSTLVKFHRDSTWSPHQSTGQDQWQHDVHWYTPEMQHRPLERCPPKTTGSLPIHIFFGGAMFLNRCTFILVCPTIDSFEHIVLLSAHTFKWIWCVDVAPSKLKKHERCLNYPMMSFRTFKGGVGYWYFESLYFCMNKVTLMFFLQSLQL